jgi:hypothetical protein
MRILTPSNVDPYNHITWLFGSAAIGLAAQKGEKEERKKMLIILSKSEGGGGEEIMSFYYKFIMNLPTLILFPFGGASCTQYSSKLKHT